MDLLDELEHLAISAVYEESEENGGTDDPSQGTVKMGQDRFDYTYEEAVAIIIGITKTATKQSTSTQQTISSPAQEHTIYLVKLDDPIPTTAKVQIAANIPIVPESHYGSSDEGNSVLCKVDGRAKMAIENWLSTQKEPIFRPLFVPVGRAYKELSSQSLYPTLGKDTILPQFRPQVPHLLTTSSSIGRTQDQYPVWYFFYGTLASVPMLCSLLSLSEDQMILHEASVMGGKLETWGGGKYKALVDGHETSCVKGWAYKVMSEEHEDGLRKYETEAYEVVRCLIEMNNTVVQGCTLDL